MTVSPSFLCSLKTHETGNKFLPDCFQGAVVMCQVLCELNMCILYDRVYLQGQVTWKCSRVRGKKKKKKKKPYNVMQDYYNPIKLLPILSKNKPPKISVASDENWFSFSTNSWPQISTLPWRAPRSSTTATSLKDAAATQWDTQQVTCFPDDT